MAGSEGRYMDLPLQHGGSWRIIGTGCAGRDEEDGVDEDRDEREAGAPMR
jgi:hypothetical protein